MRRRDASLWQRERRWRYVRHLSHRPHERHANVHREQHLRGDLPQRDPTQSLRHRVREQEHRQRQLRRVWDALLTGDADQQMRAGVYVPGRRLYGVEPCYVPGGCRRVPHGRRMRPSDRSMRASDGVDRHPLFGNERVRADLHLPGRRLHGDQPGHVPERPVQHGRDVPAGYGDVHGRDAADWRDLHGSESKPVRHLLLRERHVHRDERRRVHGERRVPHGWHVHSVDRHLLESDSDPRHPLLRVQRVYVLRLQRDRRLHGHRTKRVMHSGRLMPQRHVQQYDRHVREHGPDRHAVQRRQPVHPDRHVSGRLLHGDQPRHVPERRMQRGRDVPAGDGDVHGRDAADWRVLHGGERERV